MEVSRKLTHRAACCSVLQCVAVCCSVLQSAAVCCSLLQSAAVCCSRLQCVAVCRSQKIAQSEHLQDEGLVEGSHPRKQTDALQMREWDGA